jgi:hypothetical protein
MPRSCIPTKKSQALLSAARSCTYANSFCSRRNGLTDYRPSLHEILSSK